jgi:hypothetical protein
MPALDGLRENFCNLSVATTSVVTVIFGELGAGSQRNSEEGAQTRMTTTESLKGARHVSQIDFNFR